MVLLDLSNGEIKQTNPAYGEGFPIACRCCWERRMPKAQRTAYMHWVMNDGSVLCQYIPVICRECYAALKTFLEPTADMPLGELAPRG